LIEFTDELKDEFDYYTKFKPLKNRVVKYECIITTYINGVIQLDNNYNMTEDDQIEVSYKILNLGDANVLFFFKSSLII